MIVLFSTRAPGPVRKGDQTILDAKIRFFKKSAKLVLICPKLNAEERLFFAESYASGCELIEYRKKGADLFTGFLKCLFGNMPFHYAFFFGSDAKALLAKLPQSTHIHFLLSRSLINFSEDLSRHSIDFIDSGYLALKNRNSKTFLLKRLFHFESLRAQRFEERIAKKSKFSSAVSVLDASAIHHSVNVIPNGVAVPKEQKKVKLGKADTRLKLVMSGNFDYPPNREGAENAIRFIRSSEFSGKIELAFVGFSSDKFLQEKLSLGNFGFRISATGTVEDIKAAIMGHDAALALMTTGSGIQNKVLEAFSVGLPVIISEKVSKGLPVANSYGSRIATTQKEFDEAIEFLLKAENRRLICNHNRNHCTENYDWESLMKKLQDRIHDERGNFSSRP